MKTPLSDLAALRCPKCGEVQSMYAAWLTLEAKPLRRPRYEELRCSGCLTMWRCRPRGSAWHLLGAQLGLVAALVLALPALLQLWLPLVLMLPFLIAPLFARFALKLETA